MGFGIIKGTVKGTKAVATGGWRMLGGLGSHTKGALLAYGGWKYMTTGHVPGEQLLNTGVEVVEKAGSAVSKGLDATNKGLDYVNKGLDKVPELINDTKAALTGGGTGQGGGLFGNLFGGISNLIGGLFNGGTGSMLGLVASAFLLFGGFGWMGKIAGGLLAALSLGLFGGNSQQQQALQQVPARQESRQDVIYPDIDTGGQDEPGHTIHRSR
jgi:hypothetical protein